MCRLNHYFEKRKNKRFFSEIFKKINKKYSYLFSMPKYTVLLGLEIMYFLLIYSVNIFIVVITIFYQKQVVQAISNFIGKDYLETFSNVLISVLGVGVLFSVIISFFTMFNHNKEYFDENEFLILLKLRAFRVFPLWLVTFEWFAYLILSIFSHALHIYPFAIFTILLSIFFLILFVISALIFLCKNSVERYLYYLKEAIAFESIFNSKKILVNRKFVKNIKLQKMFKTLSDSYKEIREIEIIKQKQFEKLINKLKNKYNDNVDLIFEQNIIEKYIIYFLNKVDTPLQLLSAQIMIIKYIETITTELAETKTTKQIDYFIQKILEVLEEKVTSVHANVETIKIDDQNEKYLEEVDIDYFLKAVSKYCDVHIIQKMYWVTIKGLVHYIDESTKTSNIDPNKKEKMMKKISLLKDKTNQQDMINDTNQKIIAFLLKNMASAPLNKSKNT